MLTLFINTAGSTDSLTLLEEKNSKKKIIAHHEWPSNYDETEKVLGVLHTMLAQKKKNLSDIKKIIVVRGPGPFSAVRIGVTIANTLAYALNAPLLSIDSEKLFWSRLPDKIKDEKILLIHAGGTYVASCLEKKKQILSIEEALHQIPREKNVIFFGDLTQKESAIFKKMKAPSWRFLPQNRLKPLSQTFATLALHTLHKENRALGVAPLYWKPPNITKAKNV